MQRISSGFTLIELLIATVILMSAITLTQLIYKNFVEQDNRFSAQTVVYGQLLQVTREVREKLAVGELQGQVSRGSVSCRYQTVNTESFRPTQLNLEFGTMELGATRFDKHSVALECRADNQQVEVPNLSHMTATQLGTGDEL